MSADVNSLSPSTLFFIDTVTTVMLTIFIVDDAISVMLVQDSGTSTSNTSNVIIAPNSTQVLVQDDDCE